MRLTIKNIAKLSGFSKSTVSRVLMDDPRVKASTRIKIQKVIDDNNFRRNEIARAMVKGKINSILIIAGDITNPFYSYSIREIENILYEAGYVVTICNSEYDFKKEIEFIHMAVNYNLSGIILMTASDSPKLKKILRELDCHVVLMNRYLKDMKDSNAIVQDNYHGAYIATKHLLERGHKDIVHISGVSGTTTGDDRKKGFEDAMTEHGLSVLPETIIEGDLTWEFGYNIANTIHSKEKKPTALFLANDMMALGFIRGWMDLGYRIPRDISIICFDYTPMMDQMVVSVSTVGKDARDLGRETAKFLLELIEKPETKAQLRVLEPELRERNSVKILA